MSAISSNLSSILLPSYSTTSSKHGASCNCSSCASAASSSSSASSSSNASGTSTGSSSGAAQSAGGPGSASSAVNAATPRDAQGKPLSQGQQSEVAELKKTDAAVRKHEQAHLSAAGGYARSGIVLNFKTGPDGKQYAVGGHVDIDTSVVKGNPAATIAKMETVQKAALAPADPSAQDVHVAAMASQQAGQARAQEAQQQQAAASGATGSGTAASSTGASGTGASGTGASGTGASGTGAAASSATASSSPTTQKAGAGLKLSIAARYSSSSYSQPSKSAAGSSSTLGPSLDLVG